MNNLLKTVLVLLTLLPATVFATSAFDRYGKYAPLTQAMTCFAIADYAVKEVDGNLDFKTMFIWEKAVVREFRKTPLGSKDNWELHLLRANADVYQSIYDRLTQEYFLNTISKQQIVRKYYEAWCSTIAE